MILIIVTCEATGGNDHTHNVPATTLLHLFQVKHPSQQPSNIPRALIANLQLHGCHLAEQAVHSDSGNPSGVVHILQGREEHQQSWT